MSGTSFLLSNPLKYSSAGSRFSSSIPIPSLADVKLSQAESMAPLPRSVLLHAPRVVDKRVKGQEVDNGLVSMQSNRLLSRPPLASPPALIPRPPPLLSPSSGGFDVSNPLRSPARVPAGGAPSPARTPSSAVIVAQDGSFGASNPLHRGRQDC